MVCFHIIFHLILVGKTYMYISRELIRDSALPFDLEKDELMVRIDGKKLIIEKAWQFIIC